MIYSTQMQNLCESLAAKHRLNLNRTDSFIVLKIPGLDLIRLAVVSPTVVEVAQVEIIEWKYVPHHRVRFFTGADHWIAVAMYMRMGYMEAAKLSDDGTFISEIIPEGVEGIASFVETWHETMVAQQWLEIAELHHTSIRGLPRVVPKAIRPLLRELGVKYHRSELDERDICPGLLRNDLDGEG